MAASRGGSTTVRFFEQLYAIVVGLGLALAVEELLELDRSGIPVAFEHVPLFLAYLNLAFPLAHGSIRYPELAYIDRELGSLGKGRVLGDLVLGTGHFLWLIVLSFLIARPLIFGYVTVVLLVGRLAREAILLLRGRAVLVFDRQVARVHAITIILALGVISASQLAVGKSEVWVLRIGMLAASLVFALGLYLTAFDFFFSDEDATSGHP